MDDSVKIYGLCLERLRHQIRKAKERLPLGRYPDRILLESYNTGDLEDIVDILELYDLEERTLMSLREKLGDLAYTVSVLSGETLTFGFDEEGHLGLYLAVQEGAFIPQDLVADEGALVR
ncbi:MAG TPA: hypothetical protein VEI96_03970 [Thermodesulfovibrionales bacterium]|nr:hypothetical protein [Thermodesulfovibrionales bacterium]